jgi:tetratricopeptide (TPR) repeat protein
MDAQQMTPVPMAMRLKAILDQGLLFHRARRYNEAAALYAHVLHIDPHNADCLHLLGMVANHKQMPALALELIGKAIAINGGAASYHSNLGTILQAQGRLEEAQASYRKALELDPAMPQIYINLGLALQDQGKLGEAIESYRKAIELNLELPEAYSNLGNALQSEGKLDEAILHYKRALALRPEFAEASFNLGNALQAQLRLEEAAEAYRRAIELRPKFAAAHVNLGNVLQVQEKMEEARQHYETAMVQQPGYAEAHYNLGNLLAKEKKLQEAVTQFELALRLDPGMSKAHNNLGNVYKALEEPEKAIAHYTQVPENDPEFTDAYNNMGLALLTLGRHAEAAESIQRTLQLKPHLGKAWCNLGAVYHARNLTEKAAECYHKALERDPELSKAKLNLGLIELVNGDLENGWKSYEYRWDDAPLHRRDFTQPQWNGEPLNGARILIHGEQGHGDTLQFLRYVPMVQAAGGTVILEVQERLVRLAKELPGVVQVFATGDPLPDFAWHSPLLSLPRVFGTTLATVPSKLAYLKVPQEARLKARSLHWPGDRLRVGVLWSGNPSFAKDPYRNRAFPLRALEPLLAVEGVSFYSLQIGAPASQLEENPDLAEKIVDLQSFVDDMADTAAQIAHLDLVIASDTSVPHLAAALGTPTWVLLPYSPDWRWLQQRTDTPWYPKMRLFRQSTPGDWETVLQSIRASLIELVRQQE